MKFNTNEDGSLKMDEAQYATIKANIKTAPTPSKKRAWTTFQDSYKNADRAIKEL